MVERKQMKKVVQSGKNEVTNKKATLKEADAEKQKDAC
jgi:hypothetical protein